MNIGKKIKKLRTAKLMTQSDLVGNEITRNMLSRIENGAANPSLDTICHIASRLNVPVGYLLADEVEEAIYTKHNEIIGIKKAFMNEDYRICRDMCLNSESVEDDEIQMILCECNLAMGIEAFKNGHLRDSCIFFDDAIEGCGKTLYRTDYIVATAGIYFRYMRNLSATLSSNIIDENDVNIYPAMTDEFSRYTDILERMAVGESITEADILSVGKEDSPYVLHLLAKYYMQNNDSNAASIKLHTLLNGEAFIPQPMLYFVFCDMELCCKETEDFKGAYEYSIDKIEILQRLLS